MAKFSDKEKSAMIDFLELYNNQVADHYGEYDFDGDSLYQYRSEKRIARKLKRNSKPQVNYFWFNTYQDKKTRINDIAFHFLRHIRNSIAHSKLKKKEEKKRTFYIIDDYDRNKNHTMHGQMYADLFWEYLHRVVKSKR